MNHHVRVVGAFLRRLRLRTIVWGLGAIITPIILLVGLRQFLTHAPSDAPAEEPTGATSAAAIQKSAWLENVQGEIRQSEYNITKQESSLLPGQTATTSTTDTASTLGAGVYQAPNRANNFRSTFTEAGIHLQPRTKASGDWQWMLYLSGLGYADDIQPVAAAVKLTSTDNRIAYQREEITEWYVNGEAGLEQGFTITRPPASDQNEQQDSQLVLELAIASNLRPELVDGDGNHGSLAIDFKTADDTRALRYSDLVVLDANERTLPATMQLIGCETGTDAADSCQIQLVINDSQAKYPITVDPLASSPDWQVTGDEDGITMGYAVYTAGDVNGDGYDDVIVSAPDYDLGNGDEGRVYVYHGSTNGPNTIADWTADGDRGGAYFGTSARTAGDVNGDGYDDVVIGAPSPYAYARWSGGSPEDTGRAFVYLGSASGLAANPTSIIDGTVADDQLGTAVATAGDVNGDGYDDVMVGAPSHDTDVTSPGRALVYHGSSTGIDETQADWFFDYPYQWTGFGYSLSTAGDINGDGYDDVIIGTTLYSGSALVFYGSANGLSAQPDWGSEGEPTLDEQFGYAVSTAGDVNNDGYDDVLIGAPIYSNGQTDEGCVYLYYGSANGLSFTNADWTFESDIADATLGYSVAAAGDVNNDGYDDFLVGLPYYSNGQSEEGAAYFFYGRSDVPGSSPDWSFESDLPGALLGWAVGSAGNVNGDAYDDFLTGFIELWVDAGGANLFYGAADDSNLPIADFTASPLSGAAPLTVTFTNLSQGHTSSLWQFGDGTTATETSPTHVYTQAGVYSVSLAVTGPGGSDELVRSDYVIVTNDGRATTGLQALYTFQEGNGFTVNDVSGVGTALNLTIDDMDAVTWLTEGGISVDSSVLIASAGAATKVIDAAQATNELTVEAWIQPANVTQTGLARIVTFSQDPYWKNYNFEMGQEADRYEFWSRTSSDWDLDLYTPANTVSSDLSHLVVTYDDHGLRRMFVNNVEVARNSVPGDFSTWDDAYHLGLANALTGNQPWLGALYLVAIYNRALSSAEVAQNFAAGFDASVLPTPTPTPIPTSTPEGWTFPTTHINFQLVSAPAPDGYLVDDGATFGDRGNGYTYGWDFDITNTGRDRNDSLSPDQRYDTLVHAQHTDLPYDAFWEIAVPNGEYQVHFVAGDPSYYNGYYHILAEGVTLIDAAPSSSNRWYENTITVTVADGRLSLTNGANADWNKFTFIDISVVDSGTVTPTPTATNTPTATPTMTPTGTPTSTPTATPTITPTTVPVTASFYATPLSGTVPLTVTFSNTSSGATTYEWQFGDGATSTETSPVHTYTQVGVYTVVLTATNNVGGSDVHVEPDYITVTSPLTRTWQQITTTTTPPVWGEYAMAYDSSRDVAVLYGGNAAGWPYENDTWEFDGTDWAVITTTTQQPNAVYGMDMVYDGSQVILFGGSNAADVVLAETWIFTGTNWAQLMPVASPPARSSHAMVYDPASGDIYLFGGNDGATYFNDLWLFDGSSWSQVTVNGQSPPARTLHALAYDMTADRLLLFGGRAVTGDPLADLWTFNTSDNTWTEISANGPAARYAHGMVYDTAHDIQIMVGGVSDAGDTVFNDTWQFQSGSWTEGEAIPLLAGVSYHALIYRDDDQSLLLITGGETWEYK